MWLPEQYPKAIGVELDFGTASEIKFDLEREQTLGQIDFVQTIFVSNFDNDAVLSIDLPGGQRIHVPANAEGYYPVVAEFGKFVATFSTTPAANLVVPIQLLNVPISSEQWGPLTINIASVTATFTPTVGTWADANGTTTGGASTALFAANGDAIRRIVQNPSGNPRSIFINFGGAAASATEFEIPPGGIFDTGTGPIDQTAWTVFSASGNLPYVAKEME